MHITHTHTQNVFYSRTMIHTHAQCGLQIQNIIHKLMHFASETNTVCFTQSTKKNPSSTQNNSTSTEHESCEKEMDDDAESIITNQRYLYISSVVEKAVKKKGEKHGLTP